METVAKPETFQNKEQRTLIRIIIAVLIILGAGGVLSALVFPVITWVLIICFLYLFTLMAILLTSN
jgi:fatty acid desaturase